jgi:hypothetical protein
MRVRDTTTSASGYSPTQPVKNLLLPLAMGATLALKKIAQRRRSPLRPMP